MPNNKQEDQPDPYQWLDILFDEYVQNLKLFKDNSPVAYETVRSAIIAKIEEAKKDELKKWIKVYSESTGLESDPFLDVMKMYLFQLEEGKEKT